MALLLQQLVLRNVKVIRSGLLEVFSRNIIFPHYLYIFGVDGSIIMDDSTLCGDHRSGPMRNPKLTNGMVM